MVIAIKVIKVPRPDPIIKPHKDFPPLRNLKLDMMENKNKLKPNVPKYIIESQQPYNRTESPDLQLRNKDLSLKHESSYQSYSNNGERKIYTDDPKTKFAELRKNTQKPPLSDNPDRSQNRKAEPYYSVPNNASTDELVIDLIDTRDDDDDLFESIGITNKKKKKRYDDDASVNSYGSEKSGLSDLAKNKKQKLSETGSAGPTRAERESERHKPSVHGHSKYGSDKYSKHGSDRNYSRYDSVSSGGMTDDELSFGSGDDFDDESQYAGSQGDEGTEDPNDIYYGLSPEERDKKKRQEYKFRYHMIRQQYKNDTDIQIPLITEAKDLSEIEEEYEDVMRRIALKENVENYRQYLVGSWMVMEYVGTQIIGIDLMGFTEAQTKAMDKYERLLIELGAKRSESWQSNWPVEIRLIMLTLFQAVLFFLGKILMDKSPMAAQWLNNFTGTSNGNNSGETNDNNSMKDKGPEPKPRGRKMKGPNIDVNV